MQEGKNEVVDNEMSRDNKAEYNSLVAAYRATYQSCTFEQATTESRLIWSRLKIQYQMGMY